MRRREREVLTKLPAASEQVDVCGPLQWFRRENVESHFGAPIVDLPGAVLSPQHHADFEVDQFRCRKTFAA